MRDRLEPGVLLYSVDYPQRSSRVLIFFRWLLIIPQVLVLYLMGIAVGFVTFIAWFAILFTGKFPRGMWDFCVGYQVWTSNVLAYLLMQRDEYPPFGSIDYPVDYDLVYPARMSRLLIFVKWLLILPHAFVLAFLGLVACVVLILAWFAVLFTGRYPQRFFNFVGGLSRWSSRVNAYQFLLTDQYPPFSMN
ncbi:MAG: DUF4389 domain-containing protein [Thermomicrobiales bacterium]